MAHRSSDSCPIRVYKLSMVAAIYRIWRERNNRQFEGPSVTAPALGALIMEEIRACLSSWRSLKPGDANRLLVRTRES